MENEEKPSVLTIGERIKALRKAKGITQTELAEMTGIATITIRQYEANRYRPKPNQALKLAKALETSPIIFMVPRFQNDEESDTVQKLLLTAPIDEARKIELQMFGAAEDEVNIEKMIKIMQGLNNDGQRKAITYTEDLTKIPEYQKKGQKNNRPDQSDQNGHF